jgi:hypothetical protein
MEPIPELGLVSIDGAPSTSFVLAGRSREISHSRGTNPRDQMMASLQQGAGEFGGGIISVGHHRDRLDPRQADEESA